MTRHLLSNLRAAFQRTWWFKTWLEAWHQSAQTTASKAPVQPARSIGLLQHFRVWCWNQLCNRCPGTNFWWDCLGSSSRRGEAGMISWICTSLDKRISLPWVCSGEGLEKAWMVGVPEIKVWKALVPGTVPACPNSWGEQPTLIKAQITALPKTTEKKNSRNDFVQPRSRFLKQCKPNEKQKYLCVYSFHTKPPTAMLTTSSWGNRRHGQSHSERNCALPTVCSLWDGFCQVRNTFEPEPWTPNTDIGIKEKGINSIGYWWLLMVIGCYWVLLGRQQYQLLCWKSWPAMPLWDVGCVFKCLWHLLHVSQTLWIRKSGGIRSNWTQPIEAMQNILVSSCFIQDITRHLFLVWPTTRALAAHRPMFPFGRKSCLKKCGASRLGCWD